MTLTAANQKKAHKRFVQEVLKKNAEKQLAELREQNPEIKDQLTLNPTEEETAITGENIDICAFLYTKKKSEEYNATVKVSISAYRKIAESRKAKTDTECEKEFSKLMKHFEDYFAIVAERGLRETYGEKYIAIADEIEKQQEEAKQKRKANKKSEAETEATDEAEA